jgi:hypothetical protein
MPRFKDYAENGETVDLAVEKAYRRGVQQGAQFTVKLKELGHTDGEIQRWIGHHLANWRFELPDGGDGQTIARPVPAIKAGFFM